MILDFLEKEIKKATLLQKKIREVYIKTQNIVAESEMVAFVQPFYEMRYALEHFSDAVLDKDGEWLTDKKLAVNEMDKMLSHLVRCYTDLLEWRFYLIKTQMYKLTKGLSTEDKTRAMPMYYSDIQPKFVETQNLIVNIKLMPETVNYYEDRINILDRVEKNSDFLLESFNADILRELRMQARKNWFQATAAGLVKILFTAITGGAVTILVQMYLKALNT